MKIRFFRSQDNGMSCTHCKNDYLKTPEMKFLQHPGFCILQVYILLFF